MALTLKIPVRQQITLPDNWQECLTPQELSYWLIAKFETMGGDLTSLQSEFEDIKAKFAILQSDQMALQRQIQQNADTIQTLENQIKLVPLFQHNLTFNINTATGGSNSDCTLQLITQSSTPITSLSNDLRSLYGDYGSVPMHGIYSDPNMIRHTVATVAYRYQAGGGQFETLDTNGVSFSFAPADASITSDSVKALMPNLPAM